MRMAPGDRRAAFTLIELMVVIGIIGLLIGILVPSLRKAREMGRRVQCLANLRSVFVGHSAYLGQESRLSPLNNQPDDGAWQYNYLIYDGRDFECNFGPLVRPGGEIQNIEQLYCPVQKSPYHSLSTAVNPWPIVRPLDSRSSYGRRYHLSGKSLSQIPKTIGFAADVMHMPDVIKSGHKTGLNAVYTDGHALWVPDPGIFTENELAHPFDPLDNPIVRDLWDAIDEAQ